MLQQRSGSQSNVVNEVVKVNTQQLDRPNSAKATAISCPSELELRVPCYCEENVWRLAHRRLYGQAITKSASTDSDTIADKENEQYYVVFVSNDVQCCPMFNQKASQNNDEPCFWDYHVILIHSSSSSIAEVLDMDSRLDYPCALDEYLDATFQYDFIDNDAAKKYSPRFRVVRAESYLRHFSSDRMHMFQDGKWSSPPPTYDCILADEQKSKKGSVSNLSNYISMNGSDKDPSIMGDVMTLKELHAKFME